MAKDDYFTIVYKFLAILSDDLKDGRSTDIAEIFSNTETFPIGAHYWIAILENLKENNYIKGVDIVQIVGNGKKVIPAKGGVRITLDGVEYLENNSLMKKAQATWGMAKDFLPVVTKLLLP